MKKVEDVRATVINQKGRSVQLELLDDLDIQETVKRRHNGKYFAYLSIVDPDSATDLQRNHYWALIGDIADYTGYPIEGISDYLKYQYMQDELLDEFPSVARGRITKTQMSKLLEWVIVFCINNDIPFRKQQFYLTTDQSKMLFAMTMKRLCWVCGEHAQIHHVDSLGMGRNRKTYQYHDKHLYMALCPKCHQEAHTKGQAVFEKDHHVKGIKLNREQLKKIGVM